MDFWNGVSNQFTGAVMERSGGMGGDGRAAAR